VYSTVSCPRCGRKMRIPRDAPAGSVGQCPDPACGQKFTFARPKKGAPEVRQGSGPVSLPVLEDAPTEPALAVATDPAEPADEDIHPEAPTRLAYPKAPSMEAQPPRRPLIDPMQSSVVGERAIGDDEPSGSGLSDVAAGAAPAPVPEAGSLLNLAGQGVLLRPLRRSDAALVEQWITDAEWLRVESPTTAALAHHLQPDAHPRPAPAAMFGVSQIEDGKLIGTVGLFELDHRHRTGRLEIRLGEDDARGKGFRTEACRLMINHGFRELNLQRIWALVHHHDPRGRGAYKRSGLREEGRLRSAYYCDGRYWDITVMGILISEFE